MSNTDLLQIFTELCTNDDRFDLYLVGAGYVSFGYTHPTEPSRALMIEASVVHGLARISLAEDGYPVASHNVGRDGIEDALDALVYTANTH